MRTLHRKHIESAVLTLYKALSKEKHPGYALIEEAKRYTFIITIPVTTIVIILLKGCASTFAAGFLSSFQCPNS
jgi:hypothetical protein